MILELDLCIHINLSSFNDFHARNVVCPIVVLQESLGEGVTPCHQHPAGTKEMAVFSGLVTNSCIIRPCD